MCWRGGVIVRWGLQSEDSNVSVCVLCKQSLGMEYYGTLNAVVCEDIEFWWVNEK